MTTERDMLDLLLDRCTAIRRSTGHRSGGLPVEEGRWQ